MNIARAARHARLRLIIPALAVAIALIIPFSQIASAHTTTRVTLSGGPKPTIVLEHGAWANTASWYAVIQRLQADGYTVDAPPNPLQGLTYDSAYLADFLHSISGPIVLVGHSYGGEVITNAATGDSQVKALVYVDAFAPAQGQSIAQLLAAYPGSCAEPSNSLTRTELAPWTTWKLVRTWPCLSMMKPEPVPVEVSSPKTPETSDSVVMLTTLLFDAA